MWFQLFRFCRLCLPFQLILNVSNECFVFDLKSTLSKIVFFNQSKLRTKSRPKYIERQKQNGIGQQQAGLYQTLSEGQKKCQQSKEKTQPVIMVMNLKGQNNLYQLSQQIEKERNYELEAKKIANAYREVEQLKVQKPKNFHSTEPHQPKSQSAYTLKVKETLGQLRSFKAKQMEQLSRHQKSRKQQTNCQQPAWSKLQTLAVKRMMLALDEQMIKLQKVGLSKLIAFAKQDQARQSNFLMKFRKLKVFRAWQKVAFFQIQQAESTKDEEFIQEFRNFTLLKKSWMGWQQYTKREVKRKAYERQLNRLELEKKKEEERSRAEKSKLEKEGSSKSELSSKLKSFLGNLQEKVEQKGKLKTIQQKTEESHHNIGPMLEFQLSNKIDSENQKEEKDLCHQMHEESSENALLEVQKREEVIIQPPQPIIPKKSMNSQELQKKRQELQDKHRKRKEALERLRKQKEERRINEQQQRAELEKEVEAEEKRIKKEKYKQFFKNKEEQREWQKKEQELNLRADAFNAYRLLKFHGWLPLSKARSVKKSNIECLVRTLVLITYRIKGEKFLDRLMTICTQALQILQQKMEKKYRRSLLKKSLQAFKRNTQEELNLREEFILFHNSHQVKIYFEKWKEARQQLFIENMDWERPRVKRSEQFHRLQLLHKALQALRLNKIESQRSKAILDQKQKLKSKIRGMLEDSEELNYEQFL